MILNKRQYRITKAQVSRLTDALSASRDLYGKMDDRAFTAMVAGIRSQIQELREQLREYEKIAKAKVLHLESAEALAEALVKARVARGYTQKDLADKLHIKPQQIQRYEAGGYRTASLRRILDIMKALDLDLRADIALGARGDPMAVEK